MYREINDKEITNKASQTYKFKIKNQQKQSKRSKNICMSEGNVLFIPRVLIY